VHTVFGRGGWYNFLTYPGISFPVKGAVNSVLGLHALYGLRGYILCRRMLAPECTLFVHITSTSHNAVCTCSPWSLNGLCLWFDLQCFWCIFYSATDISLPWRSAILTYCMTACPVLRVNLKSGQGIDVNWTDDVFYSIASLFHCLLFANTWRVLRRPTCMIRFIRWGRPVGHLLYVI